MEGGVGTNDFSGSAIEIISIMGLQCLRNFC